MAAKCLEGFFFCLDVGVLFKKFNILIILMLWSFWYKNEKYIKKCWKNTICTLAFHINSIWLILYFKSMLLFSLEPKFSWEYLNKLINIASDFCIKSYSILSEMQKTWKPILILIKPWIILVWNYSLWATLNSTPVFHRPSFPCQLGII